MTRRPGIIWRCYNWHVPSSGIVVGGDYEF
jgi:hypothetical protein